MKYRTCLPLLAFFTCAFSLSCSSLEYWPEYTSYSFGEYVTTESGIEVNDQSGIASIEDIERLSAEARECVSIGGTWKVIIPPDWHIGCLGKEVFPCSVPKESCTQKGLEPTEECPCSCRGIIQDQNIIVTVPGLEIYKAVVVEYLTGSINPWADPVLEKCTR